MLIDDDIWHPVELGKTSAVLLFGWCANIRSNDRVPAALHRVSDSSAAAIGVVPRRTSAVFFLAPKADAVLEPVTAAKEEQPVYGTLTAGELKELVGRKWRYREGTLPSAEEEDAEREEAKSFSSQDSIIAHIDIV